MSDAEMLELGTRLVSLYGTLLRHYRMNKPNTTNHEGHIREKIN